MNGDSLEAAYARIGGAAMAAKQDAAMAHVEHAMGCKACLTIHSFCDARADKLLRKNRKLKKRLREALRSP